VIVKAYITGTGSRLPERIVTNEDLAPALGISAEQITKSSGIRRRHWADPDTTTSMLATEALKQALENAQVAPEAVDYLVFGTMTPDRFIPGSAPAVQKSLSLGQIPCLDIREACCNALYALQLSRALITSGTAKCVAICLAEIQSRFLELTPEAGTTSMLFGDGAAALVVSPESTDSSIEIVDVYLATDGSYVDDLGIRCPGTEFGRVQSAENLGEFGPRMKGQSVILNASRKLVNACQTILERNGLSATDVRWIVPHQANANLLAQVLKSLGLQGAEGVLVSIIEDTGNTSSASMGLALDHLRRAKIIQTGDLLLLPAFGAGFMWGAALCRA
jgi:3-oxoacyl-[acyl-carrier-protein] synthase-3